MKKVKLLGTLCLLVAMTASVLSGCSSNAGQNGSSSPGDATNGSASDNPFKDHMEISVSWWGIGTGFAQRDDLLQKKSKRTLT